MSGVDVAPLVLYSAERDRVLRLQRLRGVDVPIVVATMYGGAEQLLERELASGVAADYTALRQAVVDDHNRQLFCGGMFPLDEAEVAAVQAWLTAVYAR